MKILLLRSDSTRHKYFASFLKSEGFEVIEIIEVNQIIQQKQNYSISRHFEARDQIEMDFFIDLIKSDKSKKKHLFVDDINEPQAILFADRHEPDLIISFGCRILGSNWVDKFPDQIMGIHLGLSPYYKGAGTNFFPFVNNELGAVGYTLMKLDKGIDTGAIVHQSYGNFVQGDNIHTAGTRLIRSMFVDIVRILYMQVNLSDSTIQPFVSNEKIYRKKDFTPEALEKALSNIRQGCVDYYLSNIQSERDKFPLIRGNLI
jgi:methionyl-tRNA formyltransferase